MPPNTAPEMPSALHTPRIVLAVVGLGALAAACSYAPLDGPRDVGNMAYPQPLSPRQSQHNGVFGPPASRE